MGKANTFRAALAVLAILAGSATAQPSAEWERTLAAARKEGRAVLYSAAVPAVLARLRADFERANPGIVLEGSRIVGTAANAKVDQERRSGADGADLIITPEVAWVEALARDGVLKAPAGPAARGFPAQHLLRGAIPVLAFEPLVIAYNTTLVKTQVTGYADLLRPEFKGRVGTTELASTSVIAWYDWMEKTQGADFLAKFAAQSPRLYTGAGPNAQAIASGEVMVTAFTNTTASLPLVEQGAPLRIVVPSPGFAIRYLGAAFAWAKRPNAALVAIDYLMSVRGQSVWNGRGESASVLPGIPGSLDAKNVVPYDPAPYTPEMVKAYRERWNQLFKR